MNRIATIMIAAALTLAGSNAKGEENVKTGRQNIAVSNGRMTSEAPLRAIADDSGPCGANATYTFTESYGLLTISGDGTMWAFDDTPAPWNSYRNNIQTVMISEGIRSITANAFTGCSNLESITIPSTVYYIGDYALMGCAKLKALDLPASLQYIGQYAFCGCTGLESVDLPEGLSNIGSAAFAGCDGLTSISIPNSVKYFGDAFVNCKGLTHVTLPRNADLTKIETSAFSHCSSLKDIVIPDNITTISLRAFEDCSGLESITLGTGVSEIMSLAFDQCNQLRDVFCHAENAPKTDALAFYNSSIEDATLHVPGSLLDAYKAMTPWSSFKSILPMDAKKCAMPTIAVENGEITFSCETEGVKYVSEITVPDAKTYDQEKVALTCTYKVSVYATKDGYENSETATTEISLKPGDTEDLNGDGKVDIADIIKVVNAIAGK